MNRRFLFLCLFVFPVIAFAQTGTIKGTVQTNNKAAASATVRIKGLKKATVTNNEGAFAFEQVEDNHARKVDRGEHAIRD